MALCLRKTARHLSLHLIDQSLSFWKCFPQPRSSVEGRGQDAAAVRREYSAVDLGDVASKDGERLAVAVPQPRGPVAGGGQYAATVGRKHRAGDRVGVALEDGERCTPELEGRCSASADKRLD